MTQKSRLQYGTVSKRGKKNKVWIGRWREEVPGLEGSVRMVRRSVILGTTEEIPAKRDAERELWERPEAHERWQGRVIRSDDSAKVCGRALETFGISFGETFHPSVL